MEKLTSRQREILKFILNYLRKAGYPPTTREIAYEFGISHVAILNHLGSLEERGYIRRTPEARGIQVLSTEQEGKKAEAGVIYLPLVGEIAAGAPILAEENIMGYEPVSKNMVKTKDAFLLQVRGDSMTGDHILNGDLAIISPGLQVENGEIAAIITEDGGGVIKHFHRLKNFIELRSSNKEYEPIRGRDGIRVVGKVTGVIRRSIED